jgi:hypothetical protein
MKNKSMQIILSIVICLLLCNFYLLYLHQQDKNRLERAIQGISKLERLKSIEFIFEAFKEKTVSRFKYEQYYIGNVKIYAGSNKDKQIPVKSIADRPKLVLGLNQNMCRPCVEGVIADIKKSFPDFGTNPNIICIADIEQRFKDDYFGKKVVSFHQKEDFPLYKIELSPYFFILDNDLSVKLLFVTDQTSPELTREYLKIIKERYPEI